MICNTKKACAVNGPGAAPKIILNTIRQAMSTMQIKTIVEFPGKLPKPILTVLGFLLVLAIGSLDFTTGYNNVSVAVLYLFPIILITWFEGGIPAALISIFSAVIWSLADLASGRIYPSVAVPIWNAVMVLGMFSIVAYSFATMKKFLIREREHAPIDDVTGVENALFFYEQGRMEIVRSARYKRPLTLAYFDIDNFKQVNDSFGHGTGDDLLRAVAKTMKETLRSTDIIARLTADEFAVLMPETKKEDAAVAVHKVREHLAAMVKRNGWPVTFSIGVATCSVPACTIDKLIKMAKDLMHTAKEDGKNTVKYKILNLPSPAS